MPPRILIVGGGITGLSAAYELIRRGVAPVLLEASQRLGGVIQTDTVDGCVIEAGPDSFLSAKPAALELIKELGLTSEVIGSNDRQRVTYIAKHGRLIPMPDGLMMMIPTKLWPVVQSPLLSWSTKVRMGMDYFRSAPPNPPPERTVSRFIEEHYGREAVDYLADPLLTGVYGGSADNLSATSVLTRFVELEATHGSLTRGVLASRRAAGPSAQPLFQTLKGGLAVLIQQLIAAMGDRLQVIYEAAESLTRVSQHEFRVTTSSQHFDCDQVILACPAWQAATLLKSVNPQAAELLDAIPYTSSLTLALGLDEKNAGPMPPGFGFLVPRTENKLLVACTFIGAKFPNRVPAGKLVLRCFLGGAGRDRVLERSDEDLIGAVQEELASLLGWKPKPAFQRITRWPKAMPQYTLGHGERIRRLKVAIGEIPGLHLAGNAYEGIGIPDCIRTGRASAARAASAKP